MSSGSGASAPAAWARSFAALTPALSRCRGVAGRSAAGSACHSRPPPTGRSIAYGPDLPWYSPTLRVAGSWTSAPRSRDADSAVVPVRDSKAPARGALVFEAAAWATFVGAVKGGGFRG